MIRWYFGGDKKMSTIPEGGCCIRRTFYNVILELYITQGLLQVHFIFIVSPSTRHTIPINWEYKATTNVQRHTVNMSTCQHASPGFDPGLTGWVSLDIGGIFVLFILTGRHPTFPCSIINWEEEFEIKLKENKTLQSRCCDILESN